MSEEQFDLAAPAISDALRDELEQESGRSKFAYLRFSAEQTRKTLAFVKQKSAGIENFWPVSLLLHNSVKRACSSKADRHALSFCTEVELRQDETDPRPFELVFHFRENPYFSDSSLSRKYSLPAGTSTAPEGGVVTKEMQEFDAEELVPSVITIHWKSDDVNLIRKSPREVDQADEDDFIGDVGSFFHFFTEALDPFALGLVLQQDFLPNVIDYFLGKGEYTTDDEDESDELDDEDGDEEDIDLEEDEERFAKRRKVGGKR